MSNNAKSRDLSQHIESVTNFLKENRSFMIQSAADPNFDEFSSSSSFHCRIWLHMHNQNPCVGCRPRLRSRSRAGSDFSTCSREQMSRFSSVPVTPHPS